MRAVVAIAVCATSARADVIDRRIVLDDNQVEVAATLEVSLAPDPYASPTSIAPDLWWGVTSQLTIGLIHSHASVDQIAAGATFCVRTAQIGCDKAYEGSGVDARYLVYEDDAFQIAPRARFLVRDLDPVKPAMTVGALARWRHGRYAIVTDPYLQLGLANRSEGNRSQLWIPIYFELAPARAWLLAFHTGWNAELVNAGDAWHIPVALAARVAVGAGVDLALEAGFSTLAGPQNNAKQTAAMLTVAWHD